MALRGKGLPAGIIAADDDAAKTDAADADDAANHIYEQTGDLLDGPVQRLQTKQINAISTRVAGLQAGDVEMRVLEDNGSRLLNGSGVADMLDTEAKRRFARNRLRYLLLTAGLTLGGLGMGVLLGLLLKKGDDAGATGGNTGGAANAGEQAAAAILADWRNLSEDDFWKRFGKLVATDGPPLSSLAYILFTALELTAAEAPWETKARNDSTTGKITKAELAAVRKDRQDQLFAFAENALTAMIAGADIKAKSLPAKSVVNAVDAVKSLAFTAAKLTNGSAYLDDAANKSLTRREKLLLLHYASNQALRLLGETADITYELYWTLDREMYWNATETLAFSSLKVTGGNLNIVLRPMPIDIAKVDWTFTPPTPPDQRADDSRPFRYIAQGLVDGQKYTVGANISFRSSKVLNTASGKSLDKKPVKLSVWFDVDNSGP